ncbi:hypothetical protein PISMIDRAFT_461352 [Pisolithus microcarpus 441]|uniref:Uncharacterized protein n=1 Tax=Pisolithus microcarpus 441 TaxID=765257 RepID=A0A0C9ZM95_9AGAM|nr:hypothetical protein PISMIDRAFT_461352 [Pisolithus microcarpus 441]
MLLLCHSPQVIPKPSPHISPFRRYSIFCVKLCPASDIPHFVRSHVRHQVCCISTSFQPHVSLFYRIILLVHSFQLILISSPHTSPFTRYSIFRSKLCPASGHTTWP